MRSSISKAPWRIWPHFSSSNTSANEAGISREKSRVEHNRGDPPRSPTGNDKRKFENIRLGGADRPGGQEMDTEREMSERVPEHIPGETDQLIQLGEPEGARSFDVDHAGTDAAEREGQYSSASTQTSKSAHNSKASEHAHGMDQSYPQSSGHGEHGRSPNEGKPNIPNSNAAPSSQTAELERLYDRLLREYEVLHNKFKAKAQRLEERENRVKGLKNEVYTLRQGYEEQSTKLASVRDELRSCQSQLDNVQRFVSTADAHADQDIIQKLQELNEEVYNVSMTMADFVAEKFTRPSVADNQVVERTLRLDDTVATIGDAMVQYLASMGADEDIALFLQIAFQAYLSRLLCHIVTSWTSDQNLNTLVEGTYQRLRKAETQAISGRWRSLTRTHIQPTTTSNPDVLIQLAMAVVSDIVVAAGLCPSQDDAASQLLSEFRKKIESIMSHAEKFGGMMSEMISGDFDIFAVKPGETFDGESMSPMDAADDKMQGTGEVPVVLCVSRVGLRKRVGEKTITFAKAQVVLKSFLG